VFHVPVRPWVRAIASAAVIALLVQGARPLEARAKHEFQISARKYTYRVAGVDRPEIHVHDGDVVRVTFSAEDIPHSFTVDEPYRISKRAEPGKPVTFEFLADKPGTFEFYCNLAIDERCRKELRGTLVVDPPLPSGATRSF
jgi:heme/copper-type cytochrome/quinol oxidase subunit 2